MTDAKTEILGRIHAALDDAPAAPRIPRDYRRESDLDAPAILDMFGERVTDYRASLYRETAGTLPARVRDLLGAAGRIVVPAGLDRRWLSELDGVDMLFDAPEAPTSARELNDTVDAVVTSSTVSCAETGTIFLSGRGDEGRRAISLVPDHHICVVPAGSVVQLVPEALGRLEPTAPITMISGPSATSDIELERVEGVHGPRRLDVILLG